MMLAILHFLLLFQFVFSSDSDWAPLGDEVRGRLADHMHPKSWHCQKGGGSADDPFKRQNKVTGWVEGWTLF